MSRPKISVITPLYNCEKFIAQTIESVQCQTYDNYEHIIIDDCSSDDSYAVAAQKASADSRIILLRNDTNLRVAYTRNRGLDIATGDYVWFLDSDDKLMPDAFEILINRMLSTPGALIYTASYQKMSEDGSKLFGVISPPEKVAYKDILKTCTIAVLSTMLDRKVIGDIRFKKIHHEDYLFWLDILSQGYLCHGYDEKPLGMYRLTSNSLSRNKFKTSKYQWNIYRNELELGLPKSCYYFVFYAINGLIKLLK